MSYEQIITRMVADAPAGEVQEVIEDLKVVTGSNSLPGLSKALDNYNTEEFEVVKVNGSPVVLSKFNKVENSLFVDPRLGKKFSVNPVTKLVTDVEEWECDEETESVVKEVEKYLAEHYRENGAFGVFPYNGKLAIVIVNHKYNPSNFWNGKWKSYYLYDRDSRTITEGEVSVRIHYYEDGNVQLKTRKDITNESVTVSLAKTLKNIENRIQEDINKNFIALNEGMFKNLRRQLPITRAKMNWDKSAAAIRVGQEIGGGK